MNTAQAAATVAALSDDPRLVRIARTRLEAAAAAQEETMLRDAASKIIDGIAHHFTGGRWVPTPPATVQVGTPLRDASVDPAPGDLGPAVLNPNNPDRNPHGPNVVSAEVGSPVYQRWVDEARQARGEDI